jgi:Spy/CpxP family protein refolding chaperone
MNRRVFWNLVVAGSLMLNAALIATWLTHAIAAHFANRPQGAVYQGDCRGCPLQRALNLSADQRQALQPHVGAFRKNAGALCVSITAARAKLIDELEKPQPDSAVVQACRDTILAGQAGMQRLSIDQILRQKSVLSPEQQHRLFRLMRENLACSDSKPGMMGLAGVMRPAGVSSQKE